MPYGVLMEIEDERTPDEVAAYLRAVADDLESADQLTVGDGDDSAVDLPASALTFGVELERQPTDEGDEIELELDMTWELEDAEMELSLE
jgi:amphi-Trp domain-containing protein